MAQRETKGHTDKDAATNPPAPTKADIGKVRESANALLGLLARTNPANAQEMSAMFATTLAVSLTSAEAAHHYAMKCIALDEAIARANDSLAGMRAKVTTEVCSRTGADGKPFYSNDKARDAATLAALDTDQGYHVAKVALESAKGERARAEADGNLAHRLSAIFSNALAARGGWMPKE